MSNYRRLISYIYAYEGGIKGRNIGYAKIEVRSGQCRIYVSVKKIYIGSNDIGVYLLTPGKELMLGRIFIRGGSGEFRINIPAENIDGNGCTMDQCYGLTIHDVENTWQCYTTIWEDAVAHVAEVELAEVTAENARKRDAEQEAFPAETNNASDSQPHLPISAEIEQELKLEEESLKDVKPWQAGEETLEEVLLDIPEGPLLETETGESIKNPENPFRELPEEIPQNAQEKILMETAVETSEEAYEEAYEVTPKDAAAEHIIAKNVIAKNEIEKNAISENAIPENVISQEAILQEVMPQEKALQNVMQPEAAPQKNILKVLQEALVKVPRAAAKPPENEAVKLSQNNNITSFPESQTDMPQGPEVLTKQSKSTPISSSAASGPENPVRLEELDRLERQESSYNDIWSRMQRRYAKVLAFEYDNGCEILSIKPQDIGLLPREIWVYGNNSFLLHGYYNYRHLILARLNNPKGNPRYLLGVPGHYFSNEKYMASMFGFPHFVLAKKQPQGDGRFGYWYTDIRL